MDPFNPYSASDIIGLIGENNDIQMIPVKDQEKNLVLGVNTKEELDHLINNMYFPIV